MKRLMLGIIGLLMLVTIALGYLLIRSTQPQFAPTAPTTHVPVPSFSKVSGEIFLILESGASLPLAGVDLYAVEEHNFQSSTRSVASMIEKELQVAVPALERSYEESNKHRGSTESAIRKFLLSVDVYNSKLDKIIDMTSGWTYLNNIQSTYAKAQSSISGDFEFSLPSNGKFRIAACTFRILQMKQKENLCWFVLTPGSSERKVFLNNKNLFGALRTESNDMAFTMPTIDGCRRSDGCVSAAKKLSEFYVGYGHPPH